MDSRSGVEVLLFGRDPARSVRLTGVAGGLFVFAVLLNFLVRALGPFSVTGPVATAALFGAMFVIAVGCAYVNDGLLVTVALAGGLALGFYGPAVVLEFDSPEETTLGVLAVGTTSGLVIGVVGFVVGAAGRRLLQRY